MFRLKFVIFSVFMEFYLFFLLIFGECIGRFEFRYDLLSWFTGNHLTTHFIVFDYESIIVSFINVDFDVILRLGIY
jgi:hypothetical protein